MPSRTGAVKALFAIVQASHPLTHLFSFARALCLAFVVSSFASAHGQTIRRASEEPTRAEHPMKNAVPDKAQAINLTVNNAKTRFRLRKGVTSFVIPLRFPNQQRYFTLENENVAAKGTFSIATANERLAVNDANWNLVSGAVRFHQKREFYLSLVGVEARFVRLTFQIDGPGKMVRPD